MAAGLAGATSSTLLYPLEVVRSRLTVDKTATYKGVFDAFHKVRRALRRPSDSTQRRAVCLWQMVVGSGDCR